MDEQEIKQKPKFFLQPNKSALLQSGLQYRDVLTYGTLLSFCNKNLLQKGKKTLKKRV